MDPMLLDTRHRIERLDRELSVRLGAVEQQLGDLRHRLGVVTRVLIQKQIVSAEELAGLFADDAELPAPRPAVGD